jgi:hypothetical protein
VLFTRVTDLVRQLLEARDGRELTRLQQRLLRVDVLIIDELGFVPFERAGRELLFNRRSARQHAVQCQPNVRQELTQPRTRGISFARSITRAAGFRIRSGRTETFLTWLAALELPDSMQATLLPLRSVIEILDDKLVNADERFEAMVATDP